MEAVTGRGAGAGDRRSPRAASPGRPAPSRIRRAKTEAILGAALDVFSARGFGGATLDLIAERAGLSKPNLLYYFASKEAIYRQLLDRLLDSWLEPLRRLDRSGEPLAEIEAYVRRKVRMARSMPRESRLFANEILRGAPSIGDVLEGRLKLLVDEKAAIIRGWCRRGLIAPVDPHHLIFSIWATTQHYADFDVQVRAVLGSDDDRRFADAESFLVDLYGRGLAPRR
jgi:TetR/AcrR family transcriptional regulator